MNGFDYIRALCMQYSVPALNRQIQAIAEMQAQDQWIDIVVFGQFKAGKSSFLNHLIGKDVLPVGVIPVTAVITRIQHGPREKAQIFLFNGASFEVSVDQVGQYITEKNNSNNQKQVERIEIELPIPEELRDFRFVDTPGLGSIFKHNTATAQEWFCYSGLALILIASNAPLSDHDLHILRSVMEHTPEIRIILTKADLVESENLQEICLFVQESLKENFEQDFPLLVYSTKIAHYREKLIHELIQPFAKGKERTFRNILDHKILHLAKSAIRYFEVAYQSSMQNEFEHRQLKEKILDEQTQIHQIREDLRLIINDHKARTRTSIENILRKYQQPLEDEITQAFHQAYLQWKGNLYRKSRCFEEWMKDILHQKLMRLAEKELPAMNEIVKKAKKHVAQYARSFRERLNHNIESVLGVTMHEEDWPIRVSSLSNPDISVGKAFDISLDLLWFLFPMAIWNRVFRNYFANHISLEVEKNIQRLISDYTEMIHREMDHIRHQAIEYMTDEIASITNLLAARERNDSQTFQTIIENLATHYNIPLIPTP